MKSAMRHVEEMNRLEDAIKKTKSVYLKNDYCKNLKTKRNELKEYCMYRGFDYQKVIMGDFTIK